MRMQKQMDRIEDQQRRLVLGQPNVSPQALDNRWPLPSSMARSNAETIKDADEMPMSTSDAIPKQPADKSGHAPSSNSASRSSSARNRYYSASRTMR
jgi:hypothetical protein